MGLSVWRTGTAIAKLLEVIEALFGAARNVLAFGNILGQLAHTRRQVVKNPMDPRSRRRVRVVHDQGEALGPCRDPAPLQGWRDVLGITGVLDGDRRAFGKSSAGQLHMVLSGLLGRNRTCHKRAECQTESGTNQSQRRGLHSWTRTSVFTERLDRKSV